ncbi:hypothetical protein D3C80_105740 [compost metagenome]
MPKNILVIPDTQIRPDNLELNRPLLEAVGELIVTWRPDVVVHIGDHFDMQSLSLYDFPKNNRVVFDGKEVMADVDAGKDGLAALLKPLWQLQIRQSLNKKKMYNPELHFTMGNHEQRVDRFNELKGLVNLSKEIEWWGFKVHPFLKPVEIEGVHFVHYAYNAMSGKPIGGTAEYRLNKLKLSFVQGHEQTFKYAQEYLNDGRKISALVGGSCYLHDEVYKGFQGNNHFRGCFMLHNVHDGMYDLEQVSAERLLGK